MIKESFSTNVCQINFDSKLVKDLPGHKLGKVNRLAVTLHQESGTKLLNISKTEDSTGETEAKKIRETLSDWKVDSHVIAMGFDTTSSNTGVNKGACKVLQEVLDQQLLWMACRHHTLELILSSAFTELFGTTNGPEVPLFKKLLDVWQELDLSDLILPDIPTYLQQQAEEILSFVDGILSSPSSLPRCDYKELLELSKVFLGGSISRKNGYKFQIQTPGAYHHARWMSKAIYILKMCLLQHQLNNIHHSKKKKLTKLALFIVFIYLKPWFTANSVTNAARTDLALFNNLTSYEKIDKKVAASCKKVLQRHTWYLSEESIPFSLFEDGIPLTERKNLAMAILNSSVNNLTVTPRKPTLPSITKDSQLHDFAGPRSGLLFQLVGVPMDFLKKNNWHLTDDFQKVKECLKHLSSTNDSAERAISLLSNYNTRLTKNEQSFQELLQVVENHRAQFSVSNKKNLKRFL